MDEKLKEAVEISKAMKGYGESMCLVYSKEPFKTADVQERDKAIELLRSITESYLASSGELPKKLDLESEQIIDSNATKHTVDSYNFALDDCRMAMMKRVKIPSREELIKKVNEFYPCYENNAKLCDPNGCVICITDKILTYLKEEK